jgi:four helix bundle protein
MTETSKKPPYNLEERTAIFSKEIIKFVKNMESRRINDNLIRQLLKSATSIGANYREANGASSKKDFCNKIHFCKKESKETEYWLEMLAESNPENIDEDRKLWKECHELTLIFSKIITSSKKSK